MKVAAATETLGGKGSEGECKPRRGDRIQPHFSTKRIAAATKRRICGFNFRPLNQASETRKLHRLAAPVALDLAPLLCALLRPLEQASRSPRVQRVDWKR